jgi:hypothetical protein
LKWRIHKKPRVAGPSPAMTLERFQADWKTGGSVHCHCEEPLATRQSAATQALDRIATSQSGSSQ